MGWGLTDVDPSGIVTGQGKTIAGADLSTGGVPSPGDALDWVKGGIHNEFQANYLHPGQDPNLAESRGMQGGYLDTLGLAAQGKGPSAATDMVNAERAKNNANAVGLAKGMPGAGYGAQQSMASQGAAQANSEAATAGAQIRSKEQQASQQLYAQALDAYRRGDIDTYKAAAQAFADAERANGQVAAENAGADRGIISGTVSGIAGGFGL